MVAINKPVNVPPASFNSVQAYCAVNKDDTLFYNGINIESVALDVPNGKATIQFSGPFVWPLGQFVVEIADQGDPCVPWHHTIKILDFGIPSETEGVEVCFWSVDPATGIATPALPKRFWFVALRHGDGFALPRPTV